MKPKGTTIFKLVLSAIDVKLLQGIAGGAALGGRRRPQPSADADDAQTAKDQLPDYTRELQL